LPNLKNPNKEINLQPIKEIDKKKKNEAKVKTL
jgi:hypothetical protein